MGLPSYRFCVWVTPTYVAGREAGRLVSFPQSRRSWRAWSLRASLHSVGFMHVRVRYNQPVDLGGLSFARRRLHLHIERHRHEVLKLCHEFGCIFLENAYAVGADSHLPIASISDEITHPD